MACIVRLVNSFRHAQDGQDLLEYALLVALIAFVAIGAMTAAGRTWLALYDAIATAMPA